MRYTITGRNIDVTKTLRNIIEDKLSKLDKFFEENTEVLVTLSVNKKRHTMEITIPMGGSLIRAEVETDNMYKALDEAVDIVERQVAKYKSKLKRKNKTDKLFKIDFFDNENEIDEDIIDIVRSKKFALKPMDPEEACLQMDLVGHNFFVFFNGNTEEVNVVYKRKKSGTYGLIEPQF